MLGVPPLGYGEPVSEWDEMLAIGIDRAYATIEHDPGFLLETDGGPVGAKAGIVVARLYGFDDQLDDEVRLTEALGVYRRPIYQRTVLAEPDPSPLDQPSVARYRLQSAWARFHLAAEMGAPPDVPIDPATFAVSVLCLRYRRRPEPAPLRW